MPKLILPSNESSTNMQPMSVAGVADAVSSGAAIGKVQQGAGASAVVSATSIGDQQAQLGNYITNQGMNRLGPALKSMNDAIYNIVYANASKDYNTQAQNSIKNMVAGSKDPLTNYSKAAQFRNPRALASQLDQISGNVVDNYGQAILDPADKAKFTSNMQALNNSHKVLAGNVQRDSEMQTAQTALQDTINTSIENGLIDSPENLGYYASQGLERISSAVESGVIDATTAAKLGDQLRKGLYVGALQLANQKDPGSISDLLEKKTPEELNLTPVEYQQIVKQNKLAMVDVHNLGKLQYQSEKEIENFNSRLTFESINDKILNGKGTAVEIQDMYDKGRLSYDQYLNLQRNLTKSVNTTTQAGRVNANISSNIASGENLSDFTPQQINAHYENTLRSLSPDGNPASVSLMDKALVASQYKGPIASLSRNFKYALDSGDPDKIKEAVEAYNKVNTASPYAVSDFNNNAKDLAYMSSLSALYKYTTALDKNTIQKVHDSIYNVDGRTLKARENAFYSNPDFSAANMGSTIADMYPGGNPWYRGEDAVSKDTQDMLYGLFKTAYTITGDADKAKEMVRNQTKTLVGHSDVNNIERLGMNAGTIMSLPPEAVYNGKYSSEQMRQAINSEVAKVVPEGVNPDQVLVGSDDLTLEQAKRGKNPSYYLYYLDKDGNENFLTDPKTGQLKRWSMDQTSDAISKLSNIVRTGKASGLLEQGNIDLSSLPKVKNPDGSYSTVQTITAEIDGKTVLLPTTIEGQKVSNQAAIEYYKITGKHLGIFVNESTAEKYDNYMHQSMGWTKDGSAMSPELSQLSSTLDKPKAKALSDIHSTLSNTIGYGKSPILDDNFIAKAAQTGTIRQIASHYPGSSVNQRTVQSSIIGMVGKDPSSWRLAQSLKLINSVLLNNSQPSTYLKFGKVTTSPNQGDIVVTGDKAGLFVGMRAINGVQAVEFTRMDSSSNKGALVSEVVPLKDIKGFRSLPTPEQSYKQSESSFSKTPSPIWNVYGRGAAVVGRTPTGQERFNPYTMQTYLENPDKKPKDWVVDPATGKSVEMGQSFNEQLTGAIEKGKSAKSQSKEQVTVNDSPVGQEATGSASPVQDNLVATSNPVSGDTVVTKNGARAQIVQFENGKIRLSNGMVISKKDVTSYLTKGGG